MKYTTIFLLTVTIVFFSCRKLPNDGIPTYIHLANPKLETGPNQGSAIHGFSDLWIETQGKDLGAYEYPSIFAAYVAGQQTVTVNAGIFYNGSPSDRRIYDALDPFEAEINFIQKDTILIEPIFKYRESVNFIYIEDFESSNNFSGVARTEEENINNISGKAGAISLSITENFKSSTTISPISIATGQRVYLEMSLKTQNYGGFGLQSVSDPSQRKTIGTFAPFNNWITNYFSLTNDINGLKEGEYNFYIDVEKGDSTITTTTYIDNFKILQF